MKSDAGIFQCQLYFRNPDFDSDSKKVTFALSYLQDVAQEWFEPGISGLTNEPPEWSNNWKTSWMNSVLILDLTMELVMLNMN
jgi:hypothetical protein